MDDYKRVAETSERLKEALQLSGKKRIDIAKETGIDKGSISNYTSGRYEPKLLAIKKLAKSLNVSEMWLWGYDVPKERPVPTWTVEGRDLKSDEKAEYQNLVERLAKLRTWSKNTTMKSADADNSFDNILKADGEEAYQEALNLADRYAAQTELNMELDSIYHSEKIPQLTEALENIQAKLQQDEDFIMVVSALSKLPDATYGSLKQLILSQEQK